MTSEKRSLSINSTIRSFNSVFSVFCAAGAVHFLLFDSSVKLIFNPSFQNFLRNQPYKNKKTALYVCSYCRPETTATNKHNRPVALVTPYYASAHIRTILRGNSITAILFVFILSYIAHFVKSFIENYYFSFFSMNIARSVDKINEQMV